MFCAVKDKTRVYLFKRIFHDVGILPAQIVVPGTSTTALLQQLLPNTDYNVGVVALYSDGEGPALSDDGKTRTIRLFLAFRSFCSST